MQNSPSSNETLLIFSRAKDAANSACPQGAHRQVGKADTWDNPTQVVTVRREPTYNATETHIQEQCTQRGVGIGALLQQEVMLGGLGRRESVEGWPST